MKRRQSSNDSLGLRLGSATALLAWCALVACSATAQPPEVSLSEFALTDALAEDGVHLSAVGDNFTPQVSSEAALKTAAIMQREVTVDEVLLAHIRFEGNSAVDTEAWIVNFDPHDSDLVGPKPEGAVKFAVAFVDATSGEFIYAMGEQEPPATGWGFPEPFRATPINE
jgi:hypothetical protein